MALHGYTDTRIHGPPPYSRSDGQAVSPPVPYRNIVKPERLYPSGGGGPIIEHRCQPVNCSLPDRNAVGNIRLTGSSDLQVLEPAGDFVLGAKQVLVGQTSSHKESSIGRSSRGAALRIVSSDFSAKRSEVDRLRRALPFGQRAGRQHQHGPPSCPW
jgi:hypothetical protein